MLAKLISNYGFRASILVGCGLLVGIGACRRRPGPVQDDPGQAEPVIQETPPQSDPEPEPEPLPPPPPEPEPEPEPVPPLRVAVLLSNSAPHYRSVQTAFLNVAGADDTTVLTLGPDPGSFVSDIEAAGADNVVAIGLPAALAARQLASSKVVFCQVLNYEGQGLISPNARGVDTVPNIAPAVKLWMQLDPGLQRIGTITGDGHAARIAQARAELAKLGVELEHRVTNSDKETVLEFQRLLREVDGFWLFPDNRILSSSSIREMMSAAARRNVGILANAPGFHEVGAFLCATHDPEEIASHAYSLLDDARGAERFESRAMTPLNGCKITVRAELAAKLGYAVESIPPELLAP